MNTVCEHAVCPATLDNTSLCKCTVDRIDGDHVLITKEVKLMLEDLMYFDTVPDDYRDLISETFGIDTI